MPGLIIRWLVTTLAILIVPQLVSGVKIDGFGTALAAAAILGVLNAIIRPVLIVLTLPLTIVTLGIFILVINALMFQLAGAFLSGFRIESFWSAFFGSLIVSAVSWVLNYSVIGSREETFVVHTRRTPVEGEETVDMRRGDDGRWE